MLIAEIPFMTNCPYPNKEESFWKYLLGGAKKRSRADGHFNDITKIKEFKITVDDLKNQFALQKGLCYYFNKPLDKNYNYMRNHPLAISVDRIDNSKGYFPDNIVLCYRCANLGRGEFDQSKFEEVIEYLTKVIN